MNPSVSLAKYYWAIWFVGLVVYVAAASTTSLSNYLGWFALFSFLLSGGAYNFEFGRLMGFLKTHAPAKHATLTKRRGFEVFAFLDPTFLREMFSSNVPAEWSTFREAFVFAAVSLLVPMILVWNI